MTFEEWLTVINNEVNLFVQEFNENYSADFGADFCCYPTCGEVLPFTKTFVLVTKRLKISTFLHFHFFTK